MKYLLVYLSVFVVIQFSCCTPMSESVTDKSVGLNGSFEVIRNDLPVNWIVYTPKTVPDADFEIRFDQALVKEGSQSLNFIVHECDSLTGWKAPGIGQEIDADPGRAYRISFWIINEGTEFNIRAGGVSEKTSDLKPIIHTDIDYSEWSLIEFPYRVPGEYQRLRFELNIMKPGKFWIDDIRIE